MSSSIATHECLKSTLECLKMQFPWIQHARVLGTHEFSDSGTTSHIQDSYFRQTKHSVLSIGDIKHSDKYWVFLYRLVSQLRM